MSEVSKDFNHSYWELKSYFSIYDLIVIGAGIVGLSSAISYKEKNKKAKILILERGIIPDGASTKNAGFACFGSAGELLDDLKSSDNEIVSGILKMRYDGLKFLRKRIGDKNLQLEFNGGFELFESKEEFDVCLEAVPELNKMIWKNIGLKKCFSVSNKYNNSFKKICGVIRNPYEGQLDTSKMMKELTEIAFKKNISTLYNIDVRKIHDTKNQVELISEFGIFKSKKVIVATNGFASQLLNLKSVKPARAQVLITSPIKDLKIKGTFHLDKGYYYFRNIDNRILFGGGRNLDFEGETTFEHGLTNRIQNDLEKKLKEIILPAKKFKIENRWSGIMGVGKEKKPIIEFVSPNVLAAVRMGGIGIAIGSWVGEKAAEKIFNS